MNWLKGLALLAVVAMFSGCSGGNNATQQEVAPQESVKAALENIAKTGEGGVEVGVLIQELDKMKADNAQLAESLGKDAKRMMTMSNKSQVKALAKAMLKKLDAGGVGGAAKK